MIPNIQTGKSYKFTKNSVKISPVINGPKVCHSTLREQAASLSIRAFYMSLVIESLEVFSNVFLDTEDPIIPQPVCES